MICGIWKRGEAERLESMQAALPRHQANASARWAGNSVTLGWQGQTRGEEEGAKLPCFDAASGLAITASVRLDGRAALCEALGIPRPDRKALPDSALLLKSYARYGRACPEHLLGDFAFALWNAKREALFCARDHVGTRPFYYASVGERFVFASDIGAVLAAPGVSGELDEVAVATRLTYGGRPLGDRTFYRAVRRLLPGHALSVERGLVRVHRWWRPEEVPPLPPASDDTLAEECLTILMEAVRDRMQDGRSVGVHLSGGLDSAGVAVLAARELRRQRRPAPPAFAWHPPPGPGAAAKVAQYAAIESLCRQERLQVFYCPPEVQDVVAFLRGDGSRGADETTLLHEEVVQHAAVEQGVDVVLSGWGGDEGISFNGRGYYRQLLRSGRVTRLWRELREWSPHPLAAIVTEAVLPLVVPRATTGIRRLRQGRWPFRKNAALIHPAFTRRVRPLRAEPRRRGADVRTKQVNLLQYGHLSRRMEGWAASGAHHGIEYRYPLLDRRVLEFALGLPPEQYRRGRWSRWIMRRALDPILPPQVCWNPSKEDLPRSVRLGKVVAEARPVVHGIIEEGLTPLHRSRYLDMPRLMAYLERSNGGGQVRFQHALRFLDF